MSSKLVIRDALVVSADPGQNRSHADVVVEHGRISAVVAAGTAPTAGATIIDSADAVWEEAELVLKVKEPVAEEYHRLFHLQHQLRLRPDGVGGVDDAGSG